MSIGFGTIALLLIGVLLFGYFGMKNNGELFSELNVVSQKGDIAGRIQANFLYCRISFKTMILEKDLAQEDVFKERYNNVLKFIEEYKQIENNNFDFINNVEGLVQQYSIEFNKVLTLKNDIVAGNNNAIVSNSMKTMDEIGPNVADNIEKLKLELLDDQDKIEGKFKNNINSITFLMMLLSILGAVFSIVSSISFTKSIVKPVEILADTFKKISEGDTDMNVRLLVSTSDEIGEMSGYFNLFMDKLKAIFYDINRQNIIKTRQNEIDGITRGEQSLNEISTKVVDYVCNLTDACIGAIYVWQQDDNFSFEGGYGQSTEDFSFLKIINSKKGIFGQSIADKSIKIIYEVPDDYFKINSGLGEAKPKNLIIIPCILKQEVICVIEIGSFKDFSAEDIDVLNSISDVIAIGINSTVSREKISELYQKTLQQTEELQVQQEELMQSHEELTEQTNSLIEKENQLQVQQEELRVTNVELEEKNRELEEQTEEIFNKNKSLEITKDELIEKAKALELSSKYKSEFLANVSHELRTPLNSILVLSQLLVDKEKNLPLTSKEIEYASTIHTSGSELLELINDVLDLSKVEAGKIDINNDYILLKELSDYLLNSFTELAKNKSLDFNIIIDSDLPEAIYTDEFRLKQIIKNLLSNAFKFTDNGKVEIIIGRPKDMEKGKVSFSITDTGIGIEKDKQGLIFEAFKQANGTINRKYGGTGLGLSISNELSHLLGGDITVESEIGKGSTFILTISEINESKKEVVNEKIDIKPEVKDIKDIKDIKEVNQEKAIFEKINSILIIEDDEVFRNILNDYALEKGLDVFVAVDGNSGIRIAKEKIPGAIILDIGLPDMDGTEVLSQLENDEQTKNIPVHIISGYDKTQFMNQNSVFGYLKKPVTLEQIQNVFGELEKLTVNTFKKILIVGINDKKIENSLKQKEGIVYNSVTTGKAAKLLLENETFDCIILDKELEDMASTSLLASLYDKGMLNIAIIIYTDKEITVNEEAELSKYSDSIIIRGAKSLDRLIAETDIFLYKLNENAFKRKEKGRINRLIEEDKLFGKKVLIVDDDVRNIFSLSGVLESKGIKVVVGRNGEEGIEKFLSNPDIDLILMDIMMPIIDGYETIREIRKTDVGKNVPIIAITAKSMADDRIKCIESGADDYTTKPIDVEKLISLLRVWIYK